MKASFCRTYWHKASFTRFAVGNSETGELRGDRSNAGKLAPAGLSQCRIGEGGECEALSALRGGLRDGEGIALRDSGLQQGRKLQRTGRIGRASCRERV